VRGTQHCANDFVPFLNIATSPKDNEIGCAEVGCKLGKIYVCSLREAVGTWAKKKITNGNVSKDRF